MSGNSPLLKIMMFLKFLFLGLVYFPSLSILSLSLILFPTYLIQLFFLSLPYQDHRAIAPMLIWNLVISLMAILIIMMAEFSQKRLSLTRDRVCWQYYLFDFQLGDSTPNKVKSLNCVSNWNRAWHQKYLEIWAGKNKYEINTDNFALFAVTSPELDLIAKELSNWLDLTVIQD